MCIKNNANFFLYKKGAILDNRDRQIKIENLRLQFLSSTTYYTDTCTRLAIAKTNARACLQYRSRDKWTSGRQTSSSCCHAQSGHCPKRVSIWSHVRGQIDVPGRARRALRRAVLPTWQVHWLTCPSTVLRVHVIEAVCVEARRQPSNSRPLECGALMWCAARTDGVKVSSR